MDNKAQDDNGSTLSPIRPSNSNGGYSDSPSFSISSPRSRRLSVRTGVVGELSHLQFTPQSPHSIHSVRRDSDDHAHKPLHQHSRLTSSADPNFQDTFIGQDQSQLDQERRREAKARQLLKGGDAPAVCAGVAQDSIAAISDHAVLRPTGTLHYASVSAGAHKVHAHELAHPDNHLAELAADRG